MNCVKTCSDAWIPKGFATEINLPCKSVPVSLKMLSEQEKGAGVRKPSQIPAAAKESYKTSVGANQQLAPLRGTAPGL